MEKYRDFESKVPISEEWSSLEKAKIALDIAKTILSAILTLTILVLGQRYTDASKKMNEKREKANTNNARTAEQYTQVVKKRVELWDKVATQLNDIYCYELYVGNWKELNATKIIACKRNIDKVMFSYRPFFSPIFFKDYDKFMNSAFKTYNGPGIDAALNTSPHLPMDLKINPALFTNHDNSTNVHNAYYSLIKTAAEELNVPSGEIPEKPPRP